MSHSKLVAIQVFVYVNVQSFTQCDMQRIIRTVSTTFPKCGVTINFPPAGYEGFVVLEEEGAHCFTNL